MMERESYPTLDSRAVTLHDLLRCSLQAMSYFLKISPSSTSNFLKFQISQGQRIKKKKIQPFKNSISSSSCFGSTFLSRLTSRYPFWLLGFNYTEDLAILLLTPCMFPSPWLLHMMAPSLSLSLENTSSPARHHSSLISPCCGSYNCLPGNAKMVLLPQAAHTACHTTWALCMHMSVLPQEDKFL